MPYRATQDSWVIVKSSDKMFSSGMQAMPVELFAIQLVAAVHRRRVRVLLLADAAGPPLRIEIGKAVGGNRRWVDEHHRTAVRFPLPLRELEQVERALHVDVMRGDRR